MKCEDCEHWYNNYKEGDKVLCINGMGQAETWDTYWGAPWVAGDDEACQNFEKKQ